VRRKTSGLALIDEEVLSEGMRSAGELVRILAERGGGGGEGEHSYIPFRGGRRRGRFRARARLTSTAGGKRGGECPISKHRSSQKGKKKPASKTRATGLCSLTKGKGERRRIFHSLLDRDWEETALTACPRKDSVPAFSDGGLGEIRCKRRGATISTFDATIGGGGEKPLPLHQEDN